MLTPYQKIYNSTWWFPFKDATIRYVIDKLGDSVSTGIDEHFGEHHYNENYGRVARYRRQHIENIEINLMFGKYYSAWLYNLLINNDVIEEKKECITKPPLARKKQSLTPLNV